MRELDEVIIPQDTARNEGVDQCGTIVWYVDGATYATVECAVILENPTGLVTKLIDVDVDDIRSR